MRTATASLPSPKPDPEQAPALRVQTLGGFRVWRGGNEVPGSAWGRDKAVHLFQFFVTWRRRQLRKEEIVDRLWPELDGAQGDRDFKVALHACSQALEPDRTPRAPSLFIRRSELAYGLSLDHLRLDAEELEAAIGAGNRALPADRQAAIACFERAAQLYAGEYLPERRYEDWSSAERERLATLALASMTALADLLVESRPAESLHHTLRIIGLEPAWEDAYRIQMKAHLALGNRVMAARTYRQCAKALEQELGVEPLPATQRLYRVARGG